MLVQCRSSGWVPLFACTHANSAHSPHSYFLRSYLAISFYLLATNMSIQCGLEALHKGVGRLVSQPGQDRQQSIEGRGELFGVTLLGISSDNGISRIELESVGGTGGPLVLARVFFSAVPEPSTIALVAFGAVLFTVTALRKRFMSAR